MAQGCLYLWPATRLLTELTKWQPAPADFVTDAQSARSSGAAGWCFHNGAERSSPGGRPRRSFDLSEKALFEQLDEAEVTALDHLKNLLRAGAD